MRNKASVLVMFSFVLVCSPRDYSSGQQSGARYLLWRPTATSNSMGGVGTALFEDAFAAYFNPAGLAFSGPISLGGSFEQPIPFLASTAHTYISLAGNFGSVGAFAVSTNLIWMGRYPRTLSSGPSPVGVTEPFDWQAKLSYARVISEDVSAGMSMSFLRENLADYGTEQEQGRGQSSSVMFDAGVMVRDLLTEATWDPAPDDSWAPLIEMADTDSRRGFSVGLAIVNVGPRRTFIDAAQFDEPPTQMTLGVAYSPVRSNLAGLLLAVDLEKQFFEDSNLDYVHWGTELSIIRLVSLRA